MELIISVASCENGATFYVIPAWHNARNKVRVEKSEKYYHLLSSTA
jgi:hypothetical protein